MIRLIKYLKGSIEGEDNKPSAKKLTAFWMMLIYTITSILMMFKATDPHYLLLSLVLHSASAMLVLGVITVSNILHFITKNKTK